MTVLRAAILSTWIAASCSARKLQADLVVEAEIRNRLESGLVKPSERQAAIRKLFEHVGCAVEEQPIDKHSGNVICTLPGETTSSIVIGGHFDFIDRGQGIVDDWSGTSLLPSLYQALKSTRRRHTYVFVAFAEEERGLIGSSKYVKKLSPEQKARIAAYVNLECLGLSGVKVWMHRSTPILTRRLLEVANALQMTLKGVDVERIGDDDTHPFFDAKIPVISIHSITQESLPILHSRRDGLDAIHFEEYYAAYKLTTYYLAYLDENLD